MNIKEKITEASESLGIREEVLTFALQMEKRLKEKEPEKPNWKSVPTIELSREINNQWAECHLAVNRMLETEPIMSMKHRERAIVKAADVANYAMFVFGNLINK